MSLRIIPPTTAAAPKSAADARSVASKDEITTTGASKVLGAEVDADHGQPSLDGSSSQRFGATLRQALGELALENESEAEPAISEEQLLMSLGQEQSTVALLEQSKALGSLLESVGVGRLTSLAGDHHKLLGAFQGSGLAMGGGAHSFDGASEPPILDSLQTQLARKQLSKAALIAKEAGKIPMAIQGALSEAGALPTYGISGLGGEARSSRPPSIPLEQSSSTDLSAFMAEKSTDPKLDKASAANGSDSAGSKTAENAAHVVSRGAAGEGLTGDPGRSGGGFFGAGSGGGEGAFGGVLDGALVSGGSSTAATADSARPDITRAALMRQVAERMNVMVRGGESRAVLELSPPELGRLQMSVKLQGDAVSVQLVAETAAAQQALQADAAALRQALEDVGLALTGLEVALGDTSADGSDASNDQEAAARSELHAEEAEDSSQEVLAKARLLRHEGEVDVVA